MKALLIEVHSKIIEDFPIFANLRRWRSQGVILLPPAAVEDVLKACRNDEKRSDVEDAFFQTNSKVLGDFEQELVELLDLVVLGLIGVESKRDFVV